MVLTTSPREEFSLQQILQSYRSRWQIELIFKRFKQIAQLGTSPNTTSHDVPFFRFSAPRRRE
jgi:IS4 transposase